MVMPYKTAEEKKAYNRAYYEKNKEKMLAAAKKRRDENPERTKLEKKLERIRNRETYAKNVKIYYTRNKKKLLAESSVRNKKLRKKYKKMIVRHYTNGKNCCVCCGEDTFEFLSIDHINNDGAEHRRKIGTNILADIIHNDFPDGYQILCYNCNFAKEHNRICPHQKSK